jgi:hypothetical protein
MWISTNKKLSTEKSISKRLVDELTTIMEFSTPLQRNKYWPIPEERFKYQSDVEKIGLKSYAQNRENNTMYSTLAC